MKKQVIKNQEASSEVMISSKIVEYRKQLKSISTKLEEMARLSGRDVKVNQLLRECYQLTGKELHTFEGWQKRGASIRKGQHAYLFWGKPRKAAGGHMFCPVAFLFEESQVVYKEAQA